MPPWLTLQTFQSSSNPALEYEIRQGADGVVYCTCPRWRFGQGKSSCKHMDEYLRSIKPPTEVGTKQDIHSPSILVAGDVVEVNQNGNVFLMKVVGQQDAINHVQGVELMDGNTPRTSLRGERFVKLEDVVRVVVHARRSG